MHQTMIEAIASHAESMPNKLAIALKNKELTYQELYTQIKAVAGVLSEKYDVQRGDLVMMTSYSKIEYAVLFLAVQYLCATTVPVDKLAKEANIYDLYDYVRPKLILTDVKLDGSRVNLVSQKQVYAQHLEETAGRNVPNYVLPEEDALAEILFTSGTTGRPKGVMLTYKNIWANTDNMRQGIGMNEDDRILVALPLNHSLGLRSFRLAMFMGAGVVLQNGFAFERDLVNNITNYHCTAMVSVPATTEMLLRQMQERFVTTFQNLRYIEVGSGSLAHETKRKLLKLLPNTMIHNTWGSTESGGAIFLNITQYPDKIESIGKPLDGLEFRIVDMDGNPTDAHDIETAGRMILRGPMQMVGYYAAPDLTEGAIVNDWLYTNDLAYQDSDGFVYMLGRIDDMINVGGEKVSPIEVENAAQGFEEIQECACIGVEDPEKTMGEIPVLFVVPVGAEFHEELLFRYLATRIEKYKLPRKCVLVAELPRNRMLKLDRKELRRMWKALL